MDTFQALADPTRRHIIELLAEYKELSATSISHKFDMSAPAVSQHLKILREAKVVDMEKRAQQRIYTINPSKMSEIEEWIKKVRKMWSERFDRLDELLKRQKEKVK